MSRVLTWPKRFARATQTGTFTEDDQTRAAGWHTCAVGEHRRRVTAQVIPFFDFEPVDQTLCDLGSEFDLAVEIHAIDRAVALYAQITARVQELQQQTSAP